MPQEKKIVEKYIPPLKVPEKPITDPVVKSLERRKALKDINNKAYQIFDKYANDVNAYVPINNPQDFFIVKDIENNKAGIRHGTKVNKEVLTHLATAAAKEGVPLMDALTTAMRETGIGGAEVSGNFAIHKGNEKFYDSRTIMQSWNSDKVQGLPMDYEAFRLKNNLVDPKFIKKSKAGYWIDRETENEESFNKDSEKYYEYMKNFKFDESLKEPFRKEMRFLKANSGQKYNSGEKERISRLEREKMVIESNKDLLDYANNIYKFTQDQERMKKTSNQIQGLKCGGKKLKCGGKKMEDGGLKGEKFNKAGGDIAGMIAEVLPGILSSMSPEYTDIRENPAESMEKQASLGVASSIGGSTLKGAAKGLATAGPLGALIGGGAGLITSGLGAIFGAKKRKQERRDATEKWSNNWAGQYSDAYSANSFKDGGMLTTRRPVPSLAKGGKVEGPGTTKSDSITKQIEDGSFVVPAKNASKAMNLGRQYLDWTGEEMANRNYPGTEVNLSDGEVLFTPDEVSILSYNGIDLNSLAPEAENKIEPSAELAEGTKVENGPWLNNYQNLGYLYQGMPKPDLYKSPTALAGTNNSLAEEGLEGEEEEEKSFLDKLSGLIPDIAGAIQAGAGIAGLQKAGKMPDVNVSSYLKGLAAEQRKEAEYGLEPGTKSAMKIANERERRNATNALVSRGGGAGELFSNLQGIMSTAINESYKTELADAAEKGRKKSEYAKTTQVMGQQDFDAQYIALNNWKEMQDINANLLNAGISNIVGSRKLKAEMEAMKEIEKRGKINWNGLVPKNK